MTVKELIETLEACNPNAQVSIDTDSGSSILHDEDIYQDDAGENVTIDISVLAPSYMKRGR